MVFVTNLRGRLRAVEPEPHSLSSLAFASGIASATLLMAAVSVAFGPSFTVEDSDRFTVDPDVARLVSDTSYLLLVGSMMVTAILIAATSVLAIRTAVLPTWLGWVGLVVALAQLVGIFFFPLFALWAWVLIVSIALIVRPAEPGIPQARQRRRSRADNGPPRDGAGVARAQRGRGRARDRLPGTDIARIRDPGADVRVAKGARPARGTGGGGPRRSPAGRLSPETLAYQRFSRTGIRNGRGPPATAGRPGMRRPRTDDVLTRHGRKRHLGAARATVGSP